MGAEYRYTQIGILTIFTILLAAVFTAFALYSGINSAEGQGGTILKVTALVAAGVFVLALASFYSFTIQIVDRKINFWFGFGVARKSFPLVEILSIEVVKIPGTTFGGSNRYLEAGCKASHREDRRSNWLSKMAS